MNHNSQPDYTNSPETEFVDPEPFDASEQQFAASLDVPVRQQTNVVAPQDAESAASKHIPSPSGEVAAAPSSTITEEASEGSAKQVNGADASLEASSWRKEVAERVSKYRRKSPREPRYPSLQLKFETSLPTWTPSRAPEPVSRQAVALERNLEMIPEPLPKIVEHPAADEDPDYASNLIEFPRFTAERTFHGDELAEPVLDRLRILEAPEIAPTPPALGGILIEQAEERPQERRPGFEVPLQSSSLSRRLAAAMIDAMIIAASLGMFGSVFFRLTSPILSDLQWTEIAAVLAGAFWIAYQYSFLVYSGNTPGLRVAGLRLARFDGSDASRQLRQWRVLSSLLSAASIGLGYLWCFLDEDQLCWHDRITRTHLAPKPFPEKPAQS
ncbi:MAG TPA: RDD family protein [Terriglobales bacterium]|nr:RDD family protein [Terriglobales bacterium]